MKKLVLPILLCLMSFQLVAQPDGYELVWSDEFNGTGAIDASKWHHQTQLPNGYSWFNGEIQHYTNRQENSFMGNGTLNIRAQKETFTDQGITMSHTSARLNSKFAFTYGYVEIRAKLPTGVGTWPAIWTLGQNINETGAFWQPTHGNTSWPACGEIDIMEHWGSNQNFVQSALHTPSSFGDTVNKDGQVVPNVSTIFHVFSLEWTEERMIFRVDDEILYIYEPATQNASTWPFDLPQYLLLNVAVLPDISPSFTQSSMNIDYVRIYQDASLSIDDTQQDGLLLSPIPVNDILTIQTIPELVGGRATLYSITGQELENLDLQNEFVTLDMSNYVTGLYFFTLENGESRITKKLLKK